MVTQEKQSHDSPKDGKAAIQWHPGFYGAAELELVENKDDLEFQREYNLGKEPLRMDLLIIKKLSDVQIRNEIGRIFKKYNVIEYKSPDDGLTIDDYVKTIGYACLYKGLGETVDQVPLNEITVSVFRESYPRKLIGALKREGFTVEKRFDGIYYVRGPWPFDSQIVVTSRLRREMHRSLHVLSKTVAEEDVRAFLAEAEIFTEPGEKNNIDAVLQVSVAANPKVYEQVRRDSIMCDALRELMKEEIEEGRREGRQEALLTAIRNLMNNLKLSAEQAMEAIDIPQADRAKYSARL